MIHNLQCRHIKIYVFSFSSLAKIPLWRWQWMMIFMVANTVCCLITSVLLNVVDHRQVRNVLDWLYVWGVSAKSHAHIVLLLQGGTLNKTTKRSKQREEAALTKSLPSRRWEVIVGQFYFFSVGFQCNPYTVPHTGPWHVALVLEYLRLVLVSRPLFEGLGLVLDSKEFLLGLLLVSDWMNWRSRPVDSQPTLQWQIMIENNPAAAVFHSIWLVLLLGPLKLNSCFT